MKFTIFYISLFLSILNNCYGQSIWENQGHIAKITRYFPSTGNSYVTLNIDWDPTSKCLPTIGTIVLKSTNLGSFKSSQISSENMTVFINDMQWSDRTMLVAYSGGMEAAMYASQDLMSALNSSSQVQVRIFKNSPRFEFPLDGASQAIARAKLSCK